MLRAERLAPATVVAHLERWANQPMKNWVSFIVLFAAATLAGCKLKVPAFDSASVEVHAIGQPAATGALNAFQVTALREWLATRKSGWEHRIESTAPALVVKLEHQGEVVALMNIMPHQVKVGDFFRQITPDERDMLRLLLTSFIASKKQANKAPEPTIMAVTIGALSSECCASHGRGSS